MYRTDARKESLEWALKLRAAALGGYLPGARKDCKRAGREHCKAVAFPPDDGVVDAKAVYTDEMARVYWVIAGTTCY